MNQCIIGGKYQQLKSNKYVNIDEYIPIVIKEGLTYLVKTSICFIITNNNESGTGFFVELPIPSKEKPMYGLMTNNHVLDFKDGYSFSIILNNIEMKIELNEHDFKFTSKLIDVTFIQLNNEFINKIKSKIPRFKFLIPNYNNGKEDDIIYIFQYPKGKFSSAKGTIQLISGFNYFHNASTDEGSSGSPLLNADMDVVGIHKGGIINERKNIATNIKAIDYAIRTFYNKSYINSIDKTRLPIRELSDDEIKELKKHSLKKTGFPNIYECKYKKDPSLILLFSRTNHAWYYTTISKNEFKKMNEINYKYYAWNLINPHESVEEIINRSEEKLEHLHELIIMWLKLSELMYM